MKPGRAESSLTVESQRPPSVTAIADSRRALWSILRNFEVGVWVGQKVGIRCKREFGGDLRYRPVVDRVMEPRVRIAKLDAINILRISTPSGDPRSS